jgi:hypothetical protein
VEQWPKPWRPVAPERQELKGVVLLDLEANGGEHRPYPAQRDVTGPGQLRIGSADYRVQGVENPEVQDCHPAGFEDSGTLCQYLPDLWDVIQRREREHEPDALVGQGHGPSIAHDEAAIGEAS